jgi:hypothetical protein
VNLAKAQIQIKTHTCSLLSHNFQSSYPTAPPSATMLRNLLLLAVMASIALAAPVFNPGIHPQMALQ